MFIQYTEEMNNYSEKCFIHLNRLCSNKLPKTHLTIQNSIKMYGDHMLEPNLCVAEEFYAYFT
jgi:hypothetical protein